jgi:hypothetical protein
MLRAKFGSGEDVVLLRHCLVHSHAPGVFYSYQHMRMSFIWKCEPAGGCLLHVLHILAPGSLLAA